MSDLAVPSHLASMGTLKRGTYGNRTRGVLLDKQVVYH